MKANDIKQKALQLDFDSCGIIPAKPFDMYTRYLDERIEAFPESKAHYERMYGFAQPPEEAKSIIVCIRRYSKYKMPKGLDRLVAKNYLFDGRIPYSPEYRDKAEFEMFLASGGINVINFQIPARWSAALAGLGKFGRNNFIYDPEHGSYHYIYAFVVDKVLEYDETPDSFLLPQCGDHCEECIKACPTNALAGELSMDMEKCVARITNASSSGEIPDEATMSQMAELLYGCDICQDVCPVNKGKIVEDLDFPLIEIYEHIFQPEAILEMDNDTYLKVLNPRHWYAGPNGLWLWKCNALRSMINSGNPAYHGIIKQYCNHEDERLRRTAIWGCEKLGL